MQLLFHPQVFAEGEAEPPRAAVALQLQQTGLIGRAEVPPLIKHVVAGQQTLARHHTPLAALHERGAVEQIGLLAVAHRFADAQHQGDPIRQFSRQLIEHLLLALAQGWPQQQVARWVAPERQLRCHHQAGGLGARTPAGVEQQLAVACQVAHHGIDLGEGKTHQRVVREGSCPRP